MEKMIEWMNDFIADDHGVTLARLTERDHEKYCQLREALLPFYCEGVDDGQYRHPDQDEETFQINAVRVEQGKVVPRALFQIKRYRHPRWGDLYRAYLGPDELFPRPPIYDQNLFIAPVDGRFKIIAVYKFNRFPERRREKFIIDNGLCWNYRSGEPIKTLGALQETLKFQVPDDRHGALKEYNAE